MNIDFGLLGVMSDDIAVETISENFSLEVSGTFKMTRGSFQQEFYYYARVHNFHIEGFKWVDDYDIELRKTTIGNVIVDNVTKFNNMLIDGGLTSLSEKFVFTDNEKNQAMYNAIYNHTMYVLVYGKDALIWNTLTRKEQTFLKLTWVINTYDERSDSEKRQFFLGEKEVPSLEQLTEYYDNFDNMYK